jgi:hypothetical protein
MGLDYKFQASKSPINESPSEPVSENLTKMSHLLKSWCNDGESVAHNEFHFALEDLIVYLNGHVYGSSNFPGYSYGGAFGNSDENFKNDMVNLVKSEIRSVKGAMLNMYVFHHPFFIRC